MDDYGSKGFEDRRAGKERRVRPASPFALRSLFGSRGYFRRKEDARRFFLVDLYDPVSVTALICTLILSLVDAFLTLALVGDAIGELNPVMRFFLKMGPVQFIMVKWLFTAFGLMALLILKNYYLLRGRVKTAAVLFIFPFLYLALVSYEFYLLISL